MFYLYFSDVCFKLLYYANVLKQVKQGKCNESIYLYILLQFLKM